jgi:hypothetical protein
MTNMEVIIVYELFHFKCCCLLTENRQAENGVVKFEVKKTYKQDLDIVVFRSKVIGYRSQ